MRLSSSASVGRFLFFTYTFTLVGQRVELKLPDLWIVQLLRAAGGNWVDANKIVAVLLAVKLTYPMPGVSFTLCGETPWSPEAEEALRRLAAQGLVEERGGAYRLTKKGNKLAEKVLPYSNWTLPYADIVFYMAWDVEQLAQHIRKFAALAR
jgi:hypothetical protein